MHLLDQRHPTAAALAGKYLPVRIRGEVYGIRSDLIRAQAGMKEVLAQPDLPKHVTGFITRRGRLIPVLDLHRSLQGGSVPPMEVTVLVVQVRSAGHPGLPVGLCVDEVGEPVLVEAADIQVKSRYHHGADELPCVAIVRGRIKVLLDLDTIVERALFRTGAASAP
jgi:chemotaxis signal transduction protein